MTDQAVPVPVWGPAAIGGTIAKLMHNNYRARYAPQGHGTVADGQEAKNCIVFS